ncbi:MAG TPA: hypothetical protein VKR06_03635 [Ktedonosporobacter sp.]|nr:hypothetical protein [Ktedonosporobacter sp.]
MEPIKVFDYEALAKTRLDAGTWASFAGGAVDEITLRAYRSAFEGVVDAGNMLGLLSEH